MFVFTTTTLAPFTEDKWHSSKKNEVSDYCCSFEQNNFYGNVCKIVVFFYLQSTQPRLWLTLWIDVNKWESDIKAQRWIKKKQIHGNGGNFN